MKTDGNARFTWTVSSESPAPLDPKHVPDSTGKGDSPLSVKTSNKTSVPPRQKLALPLSPKSDTPPSGLDVAAKVIDDPKSATPHQQAECERQILGQMLETAQAAVDSPVFSAEDRARWSGRADALKKQIAALEKETPPPSWETRQKRMDQALMTQVADTADWLSRQEGLAPEVREQQGQLAADLRKLLAAMQAEASKLQEQKTKTTEHKQPEQTTETAEPPPQTDLSEMPGAFTSKPKETPLPETDLSEMPGAFSSKPKETPPPETDLSEMPGAFPSKPKETPPPETDLSEMPGAFTSKPKETPPPEIDLSEMPGAFTSKPKETPPPETDLSEMPGAFPSEPKATPPPAIDLSGMPGAFPSDKPDSQPPLKTKQEHVEQPQEPARNERQEIPKELAPPEQPRPPLQDALAIGAGNGPVPTARPAELAESAQLLGLDPNSPLFEQSIHQAFKRAALLAHPDRNGGANATVRFQQLADARDALLDATRNPIDPPNGGGPRKAIEAPPELKTGEQKHKHVEQPQEPARQERQEIPKELTPPERPRPTSQEAALEAPPPEKKTTEPEQTKTLQTSEPERSKAMPGAYSEVSEQPQGTSDDASGSTFTQSLFGAFQRAASFASDGGTKATGLFQQLFGAAHSPAESDTQTPVTPQADPARTPVTPDKLEPAPKTKHKPVEQPQEPARNERQEIPKELAPPEQPRPPLQDALAIGAGNGPVPTARPAELAESAQLLGLDPNSPLFEQSIHQAFKRAALLAHPDRNGGADATVRFQQLADARDALLDATRNPIDPPNGGGPRKAIEAPPELKTSEQKQVEQPQEPARNERQEIPKELTPPQQPRPPLQDVALTLRAGNAVVPTATTTPAELAESKQLLGLDPNSPLFKQSIERAFRQAALPVHPDRNGGADATARFQQLVKARDTLLAAGNPIAAHNGGEPRKGLDAPLPTGLPKTPSLNEKSLAILDDLNKQLAQAIADSKTEGRPPAIEAQQPPRDFDTGQRKLAPNIEATLARLRGD